MAISSTLQYTDIVGNKYAKVYSFDLDGVSEGAISTGLKSVSYASSTVGGVDIILNSNDGTEDSSAGSIYLVGTANASGYVKAEGI